MKWKMHCSNIICKFFYVLLVLLSKKRGEPGTNQYRYIATNQCRYQPISPGSSKTTLDIFPDQAGTNQST